MAIVISNKMVSIFNLKELDMSICNLNRNYMDKSTNFEETIVVYDFSNLNLQENSKGNCFGCDSCNCVCDCDCDNDSDNDDSHYGSTDCDSDW